MATADEPPTPTAESSSQPPVKLIFLDVDGVICCNFRGELEPARLAELKRVVDATGARVVLTSDWRRAPQLRARAYETLADLGIVCLGSTPEFSPFSRVPPQEPLAAVPHPHMAMSSWLFVAYALARLRAPTRARRFLDHGPAVCYL